MSSSNVHSLGLVKQLLLLVLGPIVLAGCVARAADQTTSPGGQAATGAQTSEPKGIHLEGKGRQASEKFVLEPGLSMFAIEHNGDSNVIVRLLDRDGRSIDTQFNQIGEFAGERGFAIREGGQYLLDVEADGDWTIDIRQPRPTEAQPTPRNLTGRGYDVTEFIQLDRGLNVFKMSHQGEGRFTVNLIDRDGNRVESLINALGKFEGSKPINVEEAGIYFLNVGGDGPWTIDAN